MNCENDESKNSGNVEFNVDLKESLSVLSYSLDVPKEQYQTIIDSLEKSEIWDRVEFAELIASFYFYEHVNDFFVSNDKKTTGDLNKNFLIAYQLKKNKDHNNKNLNYLDKLYVHKNNSKKFEFIIKDAFLFYHPVSSTMMIRVDCLLTGEDPDGTGVFQSPTLNGLVSFTDAIKRLVSLDDKKKVNIERPQPREKNYNDSTKDPKKPLSSIIQSLLNDVCSNIIKLDKKAEFNIFTYVCPNGPIIDDSHVRKYLFWLSRKYQKDHCPAVEYLQNNLPLSRHFDYIYFTVSTEGGVLLTTPNEQFNRSPGSSDYLTAVVEKKFVWIYFLALFQRNSLLKIAKRISDEILIKGSSQEQATKKDQFFDTRNIGELLLNTYKFQLSAMFSQVTPASHANESYLLCKKQFMLDELYKEIDAEIKNLHAYLTEKEREEEEIRKKKTDRRMLELQLMGFCFLVVSGMTGFLGMNVLGYNIKPAESIVINWAIIWKSFVFVLIVTCVLYWGIRIFSSKKSD